MTEKSMTRTSLDELRALKDRGQIRHDPDAPERESLGADFWANATLRSPEAQTQSVHLKVDKDVFEFFKSAGKGHLTRMQDVLRAYVRAHDGGVQR